MFFCKNWAPFFEIKQRWALFLPGLSGIFDKSKLCAPPPPPLVQIIEQFLIKTNLQAFKDQIPSHIAKSLSANGNTPHQQAGTAQDLYKAPHSGGVFFHRGDFAIPSLVHSCLQLPSATQ